MAWVSVSAQTVITKLLKEYVKISTNAIRVLIIAITPPYVKTQEDTSHARVVKVSTRSKANVLVSV